MEKTKYLIINHLIGLSLLSIIGYSLMIICYFTIDKIQCFYLLGFATVALIVELLIKAFVFRLELPTNELSEDMIKKSREIDTFEIMLIILFYICFLVIYIIGSQSLLQFFMLIIPSIILALELVLLHEIYCNVGRLDLV